ncbi:MAG TPA: methyltransferase domain-containing protein, partial [Acidimicrobiales bacterium]|nr:methyltransferase domain-containing protein [Acidimicrobiales bacterium]
ATRLAALKVDLVAADLSDPLPPGPFDLVVSALAVHHLDGPAKAVTPVSDDYDRPSTRSDQLVWLADAGFEATTTWSERDLVVVRADRPG